MIRRVALVAAMAALSGCTPNATTETASPPPMTAAKGPCHDEVLAAFVGRPFTDALSAEAMAKSGAKLVRVVRSGEMVTMDYRADRLTVTLDSAGAVASARCT